MTVGVCVCSLNLKLPILRCSFLFFMILTMLKEKNIAPRAFKKVQKCQNVYIKTCKTVNAVQKNVNSSL